MSANIDDIVKNVNLFPSVPRREDLDELHDYLHSTNFITAAIFSVSESPYWRKIIARGLQTYPTIDLCCGNAIAAKQTCTALSEFDVLQYIGVDRFTIRNGIPIPDDMGTRFETQLNADFINDDILTTLTHIEDNSVNVLLGGFTSSEIIGDSESEYMEELASQIKRVTAKGGFFLETANNIEFLNIRPVTFKTVQSSANLSYEGGAIHPSKIIDVEKLKKKLGGEYWKIISSVLEFGRYSPTLLDFKEIQNKAGEKLLNVYDLFSCNNIKVNLRLGAYSSSNDLDDDIKDMHEAMNSIADFPHLGDVVSMYRDTNLRHEGLRGMYKFQDESFYVKMSLLSEFDVQATDYMIISAIRKNSVADVESAIPVLKKLRGFQDFCINEDINYFKKLSDEPGFDRLLELNQNYSTLSDVQDSPDFKNLPENIQFFIGSQVLPF